jgi:sterol desaturase/sphingolipid hydroxylase (fatty acid hydroxylase superfamily)
MTTTNTTYTAEEVAQHNTAEDCWCIIGTSSDSDTKTIYDLTSYLELHPGGSEILEDVAGTDASDVFQDIGHSEVALRAMSKYAIGTLKESGQGAKKPPTRTAQAQEFLGALMDTSGTGGASFSPNIYPRPIYPPAGQVCLGFLTSHIRQPLLSALFAKFIFGPLFLLVASFCLSCGLSERFFFCFCATALHEILYYSINCMFLAFDHYGIFEQYKLDRTAAMEIKEGLLQSTIEKALSGHLISQPLVLWFAYPVAKYCGMPAVTAPFPSVFELYIAFLGSKLVFDWAFYWAHRALHHKVIYRFIHKQHHSWVGTTGFAAEYAHFLESLLSNQIPTFIVWFVGGFHMVAFMASLVIKLESTYEKHSGYCFHGSWLQKIGLTNSGGAAFHDFHHTKNRGNFGSLYIDYLFGTMDGWVAGGGLEGYINLRHEEMKEEDQRKIADEKVKRG